jgi:hypothetical protein
MRKWIDVLVEMSAAEARSVFFQLGVKTEELDAEGIKTQYRKLMMKYHPDRPGGSTETAQKLSSAYDALKNGATGGSSSSTSSEAPQRAKPKQTFHDLDYVKQWFAEKTEGQPKQQWTVMNFDGRFFRGGFTIPGNHDLFPDMARIMKIWDRFYECRAIMVGTRSMLEKGTVAVIWCDGENISPIITLEFDSFNLNPANDQSFGRALPGILDKITSGEFVSQSMLD